MTQPTPLYYTFGNHMHWVDMQWLWGHYVLPDSVRDMLRFCSEANVKGHINFDAVGYEKLAAEAPDALNELRAAIAAGHIEIVGASYGQPYGLFHGGESNVRQRAYGVRATTRLLGTRPRTFWEEEFDFFPQLPQLLRGVGYHYASLFFQWTWHTPHIPIENVSAIWWEGLDGSRLLTAPRNALNLHQWPEDFHDLLNKPQLRQMPMPLILQWLELMPSPDWMCRSELLLPPLRALQADGRFELRPTRLSEFLEQAKPHAQPRCYNMNEVFHGMSLGKNGDHLRKKSRKCESALLTAESLSAMMGLFGRPYPGWDVYPSWELEEAWRELLIAQHHDIDECEALCGHIGVLSYERAQKMAGHVERQASALLAQRIGNNIAYNPLSWPRSAEHYDAAEGKTYLLRDVPPLGYRTLTDIDRQLVAPKPQVIEDETMLTLRHEASGLSVSVSKQTGAIVQITSKDCPQGLLSDELTLGVIEAQFKRQPIQLAPNTVYQSISDGASKITICLCAAGFTAKSPRVEIEIRLVPSLGAIDVQLSGSNLTKLDPGLNAALHAKYAVNLDPNKLRLIHDHPYGISEIKPQGSFAKKYPSGDWMTSAQWFEQVERPFTALSLLDFDDGERGLLLLHDGNQQFMLEQENPQVLRHVLHMRDAWDGDYFVDSFHSHIRLIPHGPLTHAQRWKLAQEFTRPIIVTDHAPSSRPPDLPSTFSPVQCEPDHVLVTAFYREQHRQHTHPTPQLAQAIGPLPDIAYPHILRLVEFNGEATTARVCLPGKVAAAYKTNLLGEIIEPLTAQSAEPPPNAGGLRDWSELVLALRPHEVCTLYLDLALGRKVTRNLDAHRTVWATVHRVGTPPTPFFSTTPL